MSDALSHLDAKGRAQMVDVGGKPVTHRVCVARGAVRMAPETLLRITEGRMPKGEVLATARLAGIQAGKRTHEWIPLCHALPLDALEIDLEPDPDGKRLLILSGPSEFGDLGRVVPAGVTPNESASISANEALS